MTLLQQLFIVVSADVHNFEGFLLCIVGFVLLLLIGVVWLVNRHSYQVGYDDASHYYTPLVCRPGYHRARTDRDLTQPIPAGNR